MRTLLLAAGLSLLGAPGNLWALKTLRVCDDVEEPASLNPYQVFAEKIHTLLQQILEGLVRFDPEGRIEPALAERWERTGPKTVRFFLRKGVQFHNGEPFDAKSVKFSLEKYVHPETKFPGIAFVGTIERVDIVDDHTVDVVTRAPDGLLLNRLAAWVHIVPPGYYTKAGDQGFARHPIGTGPFRFERWEPKESVLLKANPGYWMEGYPKVDELVFHFVPWEKQVERLLQDKLDIVTELPGTMTARVARSPIARVVKKESFYAMVGPFNVTSGPLQDRRVRLALNYAVNRRDLMRYDILGNGRPIATLSLPGEEGHNPDLKPYPYDPAKARALLKEAGYEKGLALKALVKEQGVRTARVLQKQFERVGVKLEFETTTDAKIVEDIGSGYWDLLYGGCPDPMVHMYFIASVVLYSKSPYSIVQHEKLDQMMDEMAATLDPAERQARARALDRMIHEEALSLFTYQRIKTYGVGRRVRFVPYVTGMPYFFGTELDEKTALGKK